MMNEKNLVSRENKDKLSMRQNYAAPAVDIFEHPVGLTLVADMPGASKEKLQIDIDEGILTLEAATDIEQHGDRLFREFAPVGYYRQFRLPNHLDLNKVDAQLKDGVLTLKLPKAEAAMPKRIEVKTVH
jgi:HSP20 family molecular chaperone IbpA